MSSNRPGRQEWQRRVEGVSAGHVHDLHGGRGAVALQATHLSHDEVPDVIKLPFGRKDKF
jgi:hypothetical protein